MDDSIRGENILLNDSSLTLACSHTEPYCAARYLTISKWVSAQYVETGKMSQVSTSILNSEHHNFLQLTVNSPPARSFSFPALSLAQQRRVIDDCVNPWEERSVPQNTANIGQHRWRWQRQRSYVSATWPTRCLARTFLIAASSLSNKSKLPWGKYIYSSV